MSNTKAVSERKQVFLGSSHEAREHIDLIAEWLEEVGLEPRPWHEPGVFPPGSTMMQQLLDLAHSEVIAAVFVFAEDDLMANGNASQPRDNVVLEYGMFAGVLGKENTIAIVIGTPRSPTDLGGAIYVDMNSKYRAKRSLQAWARKLRARETGYDGTRFGAYIESLLVWLPKAVQRRRS